MRWHCKQSDNYSKWWQLRVNQEGEYWLNADQMKTLQESVETIENARTTKIEYTVESVFSSGRSELVAQNTLASGVSPVVKGIIRKVSPTKLLLRLLFLRFLQL